MVDLSSVKKIASRFVPMLGVVVAFLVSRMWAYSAGVRLIDEGYIDGTARQVPDFHLLTDRLFETLYYMHGEPPLFFLWVGAVGDLAPPVNVLGVFAFVNLIIGLAVSLSLLLLMNRLRLGRKTSMVLTILFVISPAVLMFESFLSYDYPAMAALVLFAYFLHRFLSEWRVVYGVLSFLALSATMLMWSFFHLALLVTVVVVLLLYVRRDPRKVKAILIASSVPLFLVGSVYLKNLYEFGTFAGSSWSGLNLSSITLTQLPIETRKELVVREKLSPLSLEATIGPFAPLDAFPRHFTDIDETGVPVLDIRIKKNGLPNYHNLAYVDISRELLQDSLRSIYEYPGTYLTTVLFDSSRQFREPPSTLLSDAHPKLTQYESRYNDVVYGCLGDPFFGSQSGRCYWSLIMLPLLPAFGFLFVVLRLGLPISQPSLRAGYGQASALTVLVICIVTAYVFAVGNLVELGDNHRFRLQSEPFLFVLFGMLFRPAHYHIEESVWRVWTMVQRTRPSGCAERSAADGVVSLYYNGRTLPRPYAIGRACALPDGRFVRHSSTPILRRGRGWDAALVKDPYALTLGRNVYLYYTGNSGQGQSLASRRMENQIGLAISSDGGDTFHRASRRAVLANGATGNWDSGGVAFPVVTHEVDDEDPDRRWKMWYRGTDAASMHRVGLATSADGARWTKFAGNPVITDMDDEGVTISTNPHTVVLEAGRYFLFTHTSDGMNLRIASNPEGPYEPSAHNPLLSPRRNAVQPLSSDATRGEQIVKVDDTSVFEPLEFVLIYDDASEPMLTRITTIDSSNLLAIRDAVPNRLLVDRRAVVRSVYGRGMGARAVYRESDHWVALLTVMPGVSLREYTAVAVSDSLDGPYTIDFRRGLVLEPDAVSSKWDRHSIENFCVVSPSTASSVVSR